VKRDSQEYRNHCARLLLLQTSSSSAASLSSNQRTDERQRWEQDDSDQIAPTPWAWSRGDVSQEQQRYEQEIKSSKLYSKLIVDETSATAAAAEEGRDSHKRVGGTTMSAQSRVRSQWEKTLQGESRDFLEEIHQQTEEMRSSSAANATAPSPLLTASGAVGRGGGGGGGGGGDGTTTASSVMDERRAMLKRKQSERQRQTEGTSGPVT
jgi:hypothetical protein